MVRRIKSKILVQAEPNTAMRALTMETGTKKQPDSDRGYPLCQRKKPLIMGDGKERRLIFFVIRSGRDSYLTVRNSVWGLSASGTAVSALLYSLALPESLGNRKNSPCFQPSSLGLISGSIIVIFRVPAIPLAIARGSRLKADFIGAAQYKPPMSAAVAEHQKL